MDEKEIVKVFLDMGMQLSAEALSLIKNNPELIINEIKKSKIRPFIVTQDYVKKILTSYEAESEGKYQIKTLKTFSVEKKPIKIEDYVKHFLSRYEKMKNILRNSLEKTISINKINENTTNFSIIGIVREKTTSSLILEDPTGDIEVSFEGLMKQKIRDIDTDDIIGVVCKKIGGNYLASKVIFPDVPLEREINKTNEEIHIVVTNEDLEERKGIILINIDKIKEPVLQEIKNVKILLIPKTFFKNIDEKINSEILQKVLKKRHLYPTFLPDLSFGEDNLFLEEVPDIVLSNLEPKVYKNYKGTTIISLPGKDTYFIINLKTREVKEVSKTKSN